MSNREDVGHFVVIESGRHANNTAIKERCTTFMDKAANIPSYFTVANMMAAVHYMAYPKGSPLWVELRSNLKSGITVSLVSVPFSISLAIAGGGTPVMGVVTAFWAGVVGAFLGGSHYNIVGPTGALSGVLTAAAMEFGVQVLPVLSIVAGLMCFIVWVLHLDKYIMFIPSSVIHGFTIGVAFIIALNQLNSALGLSGLPVHESFLENTWESLKNVGHTNLYSLFFFAFNLTLLILLARKWPKIPWAIIIAGFGIFVGWLASTERIPIPLQTLEARYGAMDMKLVSIPEFDSRILSFSIISSSVGITFIAILETLISARIADGMTKTEHNQQREVMSIAVANVVSGVMGGMPATAALARTALNIKTNATSRVSGIINAFSVLLLSLVFLPLFKYIPMSTIASLLVMTAIRMVAAEHVVHMFKYDRTMFWISILSAVVCVAVDTMAGILVGGVVSLLIFTDQMSVGHTEMQLNKGKKTLSTVDLTAFDKDSNVVGQNEDNQLIPEEETELATTEPPLVEEFGDTLVYRVNGQLTYVNSLAHIHRIKKFAKQKGLKNVIISLRYMWYADLDGVDALEEMVQVLEDRGIRVVFAGVIHQAVSQTLLRHPFYQEKSRSGEIFKSYMEALNFISKDDPSGVNMGLDEEEDVITEDY